jgi:hypothetical protein
MLALDHSLEMGDRCVVAAACVAVLSPARCHRRRVRVGCLRLIVPRPTPGGASFNPHVTLEIIPSALQSALAGILPGGTKKPLKVVTMQREYLKIIFRDDRAELVTQALQNPLPVRYSSKRAARSVSPGTRAPGACLG